MLLTKPFRNESMKKPHMDDAVDDFLSILPLVRRSINKKVLKSALGQIEAAISIPHFEIMKTLQEDGTRHIAEIGEKLSIPRPQMTHLIDRLVDQGIVERQAVENDRRIINIALTPKGRKMIEEHDCMVRESINTKLSCLSDGELQELSSSLRILNNTLSKIQ
jgi:DNA-binding MarR family transcriptional regulator